MDSQYLISMVRRFNVSSDTLFSSIDLVLGLMNAMDPQCSIYPELSKVPRVVKDEVDKLSQ